MNFTILMLLDGEGLIGTVISYSFTAFFCGSSFLLFAYFYFRGSLGFDDEAAKRMVAEEEFLSEEKHGNRR